MRKVDYSIKPLFTNNERRFSGLRPRRKRGRVRRCRTRCRAWEDFPHGMTGYQLTKEVKDVKRLFSKNGLFR